MKGTLLIKNGIVITLGENNRVLHNHHVIIEDGKISKITDILPADVKYDKEIDANGKLIMPGFINAHMHFYSTLVRGLGKADAAHNFQEVLENLWWRLDKKLSLEDNYYSALVMLIQSIKCGTTTLIDHHASPGAVKGSLMEIAKAVTETGLRSSLCYELSDRDGKEVAQQGIEENEEFIKYCADNDSGYLKAMFGLHASFTVGEETLIQPVKLATSITLVFMFMLLKLCQTRTLHVISSDSQLLKDSGITRYLVISQLLLIVFTSTKQKWICLLRRILLLHINHNRT